MTAPATFECQYRHVAFVLTSVCVLVLALLASVYASIAFIEDGNTGLQVFLYAAGTIFVLVILAAVAGFATHRWTIEPTGIRIEEKPKDPFLGIARRRTIAFADIAALRHVESALDTVIEIATRDGNAYRVMAKGEFVPALKAFAEQIATAAESVGHKPLPMTEGLSFWNRPAGFVVLAVLLIFALLIAFATGWALLGGGLAQSRSAFFAVVALFLPFGVIYLLYKSLTRRWRVLKLLSNK
jgi:membrane protein YdbS with pleckstrin-like domain